MNSAGIFIKRCHFFPFLACICNKQGSICSDDGSCSCNIGYSGNSCNNCSEWYYISNTTEGENSCTGCLHLNTFFTVFLFYLIEYSQPAFVTPKGPHVKKMDHVIVVLDTQEMNVMTVPIGIMCQIQAILKTYALVCNKQ